MCSHCCCWHVCAHALQVLDQLGMEGVLILEVPAGTPAAAAGLRPTYRDVFGDIVLGDIIVGESLLFATEEPCETRASTSAHCIQ
jgi:hypothetical protein